MVDVVVVGSFMTDITICVDHLPKPGETVHGTNLSLCGGGKGANQCVAAARLGASTAMVGMVGDDSFGRTHLENFRKEGINVDHVYTAENTMTGLAQIAVDAAGQNSIIIGSGANSVLSVHDVEKAEIVIRSAKVLVAQLEIEPSCSLAALEIAKKHGVKTIFNAAPAVASLDEKIFGLADIFCVNETEASSLTGLAVTNPQEAENAAKNLKGRGCNDVVITLGSQGLVWVHSAGTVVLPCPKVRAVDTTGAGDCFLGALAYFLSCMPNLTFEEALGRASNVASVSVQSRGTQPSFPKREHLNSDLFN